MQQNLSKEFRLAFTEILEPRLISLLQEQLQPMSDKLLDDSKRICQIKQPVAPKPHNFQEQIESTDSLQIISPKESASDRVLTSHCQETLSKLCPQVQEPSQAIALDTIKQHITSAIQDLKKDQARPFVENREFRWLLARRQRKNQLNQSLETLSAASENKMFDDSSLEELWGL